MKIVYLSNSLIPSRTANSIHVMKMCQAFSQNDNQVVLFAPDDPNCDQEIQDIYSFYGVANSFEIKKLPWLNWRKKGIYLYGLHSAWEAKKIKPDLTYGRCLQACFFASLLGLPVIYEAHTLPINVSKVTALMFERLKNSYNLKKIVVISQALANDFQKYYQIPSELITVAHDGADEAEISEPVSLTGEFKIGYVGHLYPGKGMEIIAQLVKACPWAYFHIIGGRETDINYWQNQLNQFNNIQFHGFIPHSQTSAYRQASDVLIAPYQSEVSSSGGGNIAQWMSPLKIFEYMAAAKPIIASNLPVLQEVLTDQKTALLCDPEDIQAWIANLTSLRLDSHLRHTLGTNANLEFKSLYTWKSRAALVLPEINLSISL